MTKAEAVKWLKAYAPKNPRKMYGKYLKEATEIAVKALEEQGGNGMYQCFHCGAYAVCESDFPHIRVMKSRAIAKGKMYLWDGMDED